MSDPVTVAFVDDHPLLLDGIGALFSRRGYRVVGKGSSADAARSIATAFAPSLIFVDLSMPGDPFGAISEIATQGRTKVIVYTADSSVDVALRALDFGASAFVVKDSISNELFDAVEAVLRGEVFISRAHAGRILTGLKNRATRENAERGAKLSDREKQVVELLLKARSNKEIALTLSISEKTVKHHMYSLMSKLHARNRVEVALAAQHQLHMT
ncbi:MAG: two component transcriptional regulator, LuxR family [Devosia sp.]|uniref:LuxR C-terminal-related transcriptional regulator n=1 Tax=Devosia sp. TaxID=1871048 RepID=UPI0026331255|nr:response regulator transcription factor [Devosia sp.]MDB5540938.1 two component transcriptional regulator, LuxR family [Devosia sp.]